MRLDQYLVELKKMRSRTQAKEFIQQGKVRVDGAIITKASHPCEKGCLVEIADDAGLEWVARSAQKLHGALERLGIDLTGKTCLDVGQSTGGFTQAMLKQNAEVVVGIDVGKDQLNEEIKNLPNVHCYESFDARDLSKLKGEWLFDFFAVDVSFISVLKIFDGDKDLVSGAKQPVEGLVLIKPQFEVGKKNVKKGGLVDAPLIHLECEKLVLEGFSKMGVEVLDYFPSSLKGKDGNQEFICHITL